MGLSPSDTPCAEIDAARRTRETEMQDFVLTALAAVQGVPEPSGMAFRVPTGLGKTSTALRLVAKHATALLKHGHVVFHMPTIGLAEQAAADFQRIAPSVWSQVVRGRDAEKLDGSPMCIRAELARRIAPIVPSVTNALCRDSKSGKEALCALRCPYLAQHRSGYRILFTSHAYLTHHLPVPGSIALRIVDEKVWPSLTSVRDLTVEDWLSEPAGHGDDDLKGLHRAARYKVLEALQSGRCVIPELRKAGIGSDQLRALADLERTRAPKLVVDPSMSRDAIGETVDEFSWAEWSIAVGRRELFLLLADGSERGMTQRLTLETVAKKGERRSVLRMHLCAEIPRNAPTLFLDADADPMIVDTVWPGAAYRMIRCLPKANIVQIARRTLSNRYLLHHPRAEEHRGLVRDVIESELAAADGRVLVVATRKVLAGLRGDLKTGGEVAIEELKGPLLGAEARWFGPNLQGLNEFEEFETVVIVGRSEPSVGDLEREMRCLFGDDEIPLAFAETGRLVRQRVLQELASGAEQASWRTVHPDPRGMALLEQLRECQTLQAAGRIRYLSPKRRKRIILLSDLPLRDLKPNALTTLEDLAGRVHDPEDPRGFDILSQALGSAPNPRVPGFRLSKQGLHEDLPAAFPTVCSATEFRRGRTTGQLTRLIQRLAQMRGWPATLIELRRPGGGHACPAFVFARELEAISDAKRLWPGLSPQLSHSRSDR